MINHQNIIHKLSNEIRYLNTPIIKSFKVDDLSFSLNISKTSSGYTILLTNISSTKLPNWFHIIDNHNKIIIKDGDLNDTLLALRNFIADNTPSNITLI